MSDNWAGQLMANTYTWGVVGLDVARSQDDLLDVVVQVTWALTATNPDGLSFTCQRQIQLDAPEPASYTPYDQVTFEMVVQWVKDTLGPEQLSDIEGRLDKAIEDILNLPIVQLPLPWSVAPGSPQ